jgi:hypothetical protein
MKSNAVNLDDINQHGHEPTEETTLGQKEPRRQNERELKMRMIALKRTLLLGYFFEILHNLFRLVCIALASHIEWRLIIDVECVHVSAMLNKKSGQDIVMILTTEKMAL